MQDFAKHETITISDNGANSGPCAKTTFADHIPQRPYCTDDLSDGIRPRSRESALQHRYIQFNGPATLEWFLFDVDRPGAYYASDDASLPPPTVIMVNQDNGHGHYAYRLAMPVAKHFKARQQPLKYFAAVERGYANRLGADKRYSGLIAKNPRHPFWFVQWRRVEPYSLHEMADWLFDADTRFDPRPEVQFGAGRNVTLFDELRRFAYREVRAFMGAGSNDCATFSERLLTVARGINLQFPVPLGPSEIRSLSRGTAKWIWRRFSPQEFAAVQSRRGKAAMARRWGGKQIAETIEPWKYLAISRATYYRWKRAGECLRRRLLQVLLSLLLLRLGDLQSAEDAAVL